MRHAVIMAGGSGTRLWPLSRAGRPKQLLDVVADEGGDGGAHSLLAEAFADATARFCVVSFDSDWLYPTAESRHLVHALNATGAPVSFVELQSPFGHDAFLLDSPGLTRVVDGFLRAGETA